MSNRLAYAKEYYSAWGVDVTQALAQLSQVSISIPCWQGDDVQGFENATALSGGIAVTGNYPGRARNAVELMQDLDMALTLIPGKHRINLHAIYAVTKECVPRDKLEPLHFEAWAAYAKERGLGLDFNPTLFSHAMSRDGLTLSHPSAEVRQFWINHCKATRRIAAYFGETLKTASLHNLWIPDGLKDTPANRLAPRRRLRASLDEIYADHYDASLLIDSVESKLFGIGMEAYTTGSHEFYMQYAAEKGILCLLDNGHFHPMESVADKISSLLLFNEKLALHVTRSVRWDSDHVVAFDDELRAIAHAIVSCHGLDRVLIGLDYFDATINRVAAWVIGVRNMQKALLYALLLPHDKLTAMQDAGDFTGLLAINEELKTAPLGDVWDAFCEQQHVPIRGEWLDILRRYDETTAMRA